MKSEIKDEELAGRIRERLRQKPELMKHLSPMQREIAERLMEAESDSYRKKQGKEKAAKAGRGRPSQPQNQEVDKT